MPSSLSSLVVDLQVNAAALKTGLDDANAKLEAFGKKVDKIGNVVSLSTFGNLAKQVASGLTSFVMAGAQAADQTGKLAQSAGTTTEAFSRLQYAAKLSGVSGEELGAAMGKLNKNLAEAGAGARDQTALFSALGIKVTDAAGKVRASDAVLGDLAATFSGMENGASKSALAMEVFGKSGAQLIPFLNQGRDGLAQLAAEADRLGITIGSDASDAAERFNDNIEKMHMAVNGVAGQVAGTLAPAMAALTEQWLNSKDSAQAMKDAVEGLSAVLKGLITLGLGVKGVFQAVGAVLGAAAAQVVAHLSMDMGGAKEISEQLNKDLVKIASNTSDEMKAVWTKHGEAIGPVFDRVALSAGKSADKVMGSLQRKKKTAQEYETAMKSLEKVALDYEAKLAGFGAGPLEELTAKLDKGELAAQLGKIGDQAAAMRDRILEAAAALQTLELNKLVDKVDADVARTKRGVGHDVAARRLSMNAVGEGPRDRANMATAGFQSFDQALATLAKQTVKHTNMLGTAELLHAQGQHEAARAMEVAAEQAQFAADQAGKAADGFQTVAEIDFEESRARIEGVLNGLAAAGTQFASELGDLGDVIQAGIKGAESGGVWGAIIAVVIELLTKLQGFGEILDIANGTVQLALKDMAGGFGELLKGLKPLLGAISNIAKGVHSILGPIIGLVGKLFQQIAATLYPVGTMLQTIGSSLAPLFTILGAIMDILKIFQPILTIVSLTMLGLKLAIQYVNLGFQVFLDWILEKVGQNNNSGVTSAQNEVNSTQNEIMSLAKNFEKNPFGAMTDQANGTADDLAALGKQTEEVKEKEEEKGKAIDQTTKAIAKMNEQFTNMPKGFRTPLAHYQSQDVVGGMNSVMGVAGALQSLTIIVQGSIVSENQLMALVEKHGKKNRFRKYGTPVPP